MQESVRLSACVIFTGTDPQSAKGGIGVVLPGYFSALDKVGIEYLSIPTYHPTFPSGKWRPWLFAFPKLFRRIRKDKRNGRISVVYSHAGDGISFFRETCILWFARLVGARTVLHVHSPKVDGYLDHFLARTLLKAAFTPSQMICVLTPWWGERLRRIGVKKNIRVIPNPLPPNLHEIAIHERSRHRNHRKQSVTILSMARLVAGKGVDVLIQAMSKLPDTVHLVIAGDGDQREKLAQLVKTHGLEDRVHFAGWVSGQEKVQLLEEADIFCLPSTYDAFPMSMVEAMTYGVPVVAVRWGGIPDMVADGRAGILADGPQPAEIAGAITQLLDEERRLAMGLEAKRWVLEISAPDIVGEKLKSVVEELTECEPEI